MASYDDIYGSRFLTADELKKPVTVTIERVETETFNRPGESPRTKAVAYFKGHTKGMVINKTNAGVLADSFGKGFSDWVGQSVTIKPESTTFAGKATKGLRIYANSGGKRSLSAEMNDDVQF
jgi:hypothetical protein